MRTSPMRHTTLTTYTLRMAPNNRLFKLPAAKIWATLLIRMAMNNHLFTFPAAKALKAFLSYGCHLSYVS